jgi:hypothetical protein
MAEQAYAGELGALCQSSPLPVIVTLAPFVTCSLEQYYDKHY